MESLAAYIVYILRSHVVFMISQAFHPVEEILFLKVLATSTFY